MRKTGPLCVLVCYVLWGLLPTFWKLLGDVNALYVLGARVVWSMVLTGAVLLWRRDRLSGVRAALRDRRERCLLPAAGCAIFVNWGVYIWATVNGHLLDASLAYYMNPILAVLLGTVVFRERLTALQWTAVAVTLMGLMAAVIRWGQFPWIALVIGGSFAVYGALKKTVRSDGSGIHLLGNADYDASALAAIFYLDARGLGAVGVLEGWRWLLLPAAGVVTTVPLLFYAAGIRTTPLTLSGILMYVNPTLQLLLSVLLYRETFTATHAMLFGFVWAGLGLYLAAGALDRRREKKEDTTCG